MDRARRLMKVSRSGFYVWQQYPQRLVWTQEDELRLTMRTLHVESKGLYGVRKMQRALARQGWQVNHKRMARLCAWKGCNHAGVDAFVQQHSRITKAVNRHVVKS